MRKVLLKFILATCYSLLAVFFLPESGQTKEVLYYMCDINGTPVEMTNEKGNVVWRGSALPFGEDFGGSGSRDTEIGYCGKPYNANIGLYDLGVRYYDPNTGRFTGVDPVMGDLQNPQGLNSYAYGLNSPYKYIDPDGRMPILVPFVIVPIITAVLNIAINPSPANAPVLNAPQAALPAQTELEFARNVVLAEAAGIGVGKAVGYGIGRIIGKYGDDAAKVGIKVAGKSVIGPKSTYKQYAKNIGANFLDATDESWTWAKNELFLKEVVSRGDDVYFAGKYNPQLLNPNSVLAKEINYLLKHGYEWVDDFSKMIRK